MKLVAAIPAAALLLVVMLCLFVGALKLAVS
jgi:hypothetical protein